MSVILYLALSAAGNFVVPCPSGKRVRILGVLVDVNTVAGDVATVQFQRGGVAVLEVAPNNLGATSARISFGLGLTANTEAALANNAILNCGLPDVWWDTEVVVAPTAGPTATIVAASLFYEQT